MARRVAKAGSTTLVHATCVTFGAAGALLLGPSGSGKSDLALRLVFEQGARLVADDQTRLAVARGGLVATPPAAIAGLIEARGLGILRLPARRLAKRAPVALAVALVPPDAVERLPTGRRSAGGEGVEYLGISLPLLRIFPFEASAALKVRLAVATRTGSITSLP